MSFRKYIGTDNSAQNTITSGYVYISKQCGSTGVGLQSGTIGAEDLILAAHVGVQFHAKIKSQFVHSENSQHESKRTIRGNTQKCTAGLNSVAITDTSKDCYFMWYLNNFLATDMSQSS